VYEQLSLSERICIQSRLELGIQTAAFAAALKREPSTISRELRRNGCVAGRYSKCGQRSSQAKRECCDKGSLETRHHGSYAVVRIEPSNKNGAESMSGTILVVDDSAMMRKVILRTLKMAGLEFDRVLEAGNGQEALACLRMNKIELIMCDINMPVMTGLQLLQQIKEENLAVGVPIVMVTTESSESQVHQAILSGARGYIRKPFSIEHIVNNVKPLLTA